MAPDRKRLKPCVRVRLMARGRFRVAALSKAVVRIARAEGLPGVRYATTEARALVHSRFKCKRTNSLASGRLTKPSQLFKAQHKLMNTSKKASFEKLKWRTEMAREDYHRAEDKLDDRKSEVGEAAIQSGQVAIRTAALVNGGAAVAVLAFIGGLIGQGKIELNQINSVAESLMWFVYGVAAAVCSLGSAYIVNYC